MKARVVLDDVHGKCVATVVEPARIRVLQGGVVRWQVDNRCRVLNGEGRPALEVTRLTEYDSRRPAGWLAAACSASLPSVEMGAPPKANVIHCDIPDQAPVGVYKYSLEGRIETLDPLLEIVRPRGPP